jgi:hypothetical protein
MLIDEEWLKNNPLRVTLIKDTYPMHVENMKGIIRKIDNEDLSSFFNMSNLRREVHELEQQVERLNSELGKEEGPSEDEPEPKLQLSL